ncbi:MAG TPA: hypothetical protein VNS32_29185, partial [Flavisolibacter sp.]|nr:hypothetical protein [Flavisolibacter sp.]
ITLNTGETFFEMLNAAFKSGEKVNMIIDDNGMTRVEGIIQKITTDRPAPIIEIENKGKFPLDKIVAVNGIFRPEYGEC